MFSPLKLALGGAALALAVAAFASGTLVIDQTETPPAAESPTPSYTFETRPIGVEGAIVGKALYAGRFTLPEARLVILLAAAQTRSRDPLVYLSTYSHLVGCDPSLESILQLFFGTLALGNIGDDAQYGGFTLVANQFGGNDGRYFFALLGQ